MKKIIVSLLCICCFSFSMHGQHDSKKESEALYFLETDANWEKEFFKFPLRFAQEIPYKGIEDARFPQGWGDQESPNFWSYAFAWNIDANSPITKQEVEENLQLYFDGLMSIKHIKNGDPSIKNTIAQFNKKDMSHFTGTIITYDNFSTKKMMTLYTLVEAHYCEKQQKSMILFKFSPKTFENNVWKHLEGVTLATNFCNHKNK